MKDGFIKVAACSPEIKVGQPIQNAGIIIGEIKKLKEESDPKIVVFPELILCGKTCGDLISFGELTGRCEKALGTILSATQDDETVYVIGMPVVIGGKAESCAAVISGGEICGIAVKDAAEDLRDVFVCGAVVPVLDEIDVKVGEMTVFTLRIGFGIKSCAGGRAYCCLASDAETYATEDRVKNQIKTISELENTAIIYASNPVTESTTDGFYCGRTVIAERGQILDCGEYGKNASVSEIDIMPYSGSNLSFVGISLSACETKLTRKYPVSPFIPEDKEEEKRNAEKILTIQAYSLKRRMEAISAKTAVIGISGGLDSTLALLAAVRAFDLMGLDRKNVIAITMPCFGTSERTKNNALALCDLLGVTLREIRIADAVNIHFRDIGHDPSVMNAAFENSQARERTQILMDIANDVNGLVIGTGDLSELALGWATYNGDHMSNYGLNGSVPKTLVRSVVKYEANRLGDKIYEILTDVIETPVSPELLPTDDSGKIAQKTEDLVGPYELHDFFIWYFVKEKMTADKVYRIACHAFAGQYDAETVKKWLKTFIRRFFTQQFKRSCLPDGVCATPVTLSPRGFFNMPSDVSYSEWLGEF